MFDLEPGPLERLDANALRRVPATPSFESILGGGVESQQGIDGTLDAASRDVGGDGVPDIDGAYSSTVGVASETLADQAGAENDGVAGTLSDRTGGAESYRQSALPHLPQPSAAIEGDYVDPPKPEGLPDDTSGGGDRHNV